VADQVRIHALANPAAIAAAQDVITRALFRILGVSDPAKHDVSVSAASGWVSYLAKDEVWSRPQPPVLPTADVARQRAEAFIAAVAAATASGADGWPANLAQISLLPRLMRPVQLSAVPRPNAPLWDHWLYRAQPRLTLDPAGRQSVPVFGTHVEVRIGDRGQVVSFRSRWRPLSGERITTDLTPFKAPPHDDGGGAREEERGRDQAHDLQYVLDGEIIPQHYLAPYYLTSDGDLLQMVSASPYSLTVELGRVQGPESMLVTAMASGGSGDYAYNFAAYTLNRVDEGYTALGRGQSVETETADGTALVGAVEIPNGAYVVLVNVRDRATGAFKHTQQQVVSTLSAGQLERVLGGQTPVA
jgi:hypothetical protein